MLATVTTSEMRRPWAVLPSAALLHRARCVFPVRDDDTYTAGQTQGRHEYAETHHRSGPRSMGRWIQLGCCRIRAAESGFYSFHPAEPAAPSSWSDIPTAVSSSAMHKPMAPM